MEDSTETWNEATAISAADEAARLSELLSRKDFYKSEAIRWLTSQHMAKFLNALDAMEALKLKQFAEGWHYSADRSTTYGLTLLEDLTERCEGFSLVCKLSEYCPVWIVRWWKWRLGKRDNSSWFERHGKEYEKSIEGLIGHLSRCANILDGIEIVNVVIAGLKEADALKLLNRLSNEWDGPLESNPIMQAIRGGNNSLDRILRVPWQSCVFPSEKDSKFWEDSIGRSKVDAAIVSAIHAAPSNMFQLELGFSCGWRMAEQKEVPSAATLAAKLKELGVTPQIELINDVLPMAALWATLRKLAEYEKNSWSHKTELIGLRAQISKLVADNPQLWARSLQWILARSSAIGPTADAITIEFSSIDGEIRSALESACDSENEHVRLMARGIRTMLLGFDEPDSALGKILADAAARYMDGIPLFPHPLAPLSSTWLGSIGVECAIQGGIRRACDRFATEVREQGGDIEESLTKALVKELEVEFRNVKPRLGLIGIAGTGANTPVLSVQQRPASKTIEEPKYGCDIAWIITGVVRGSFDATWVDLVQVKKSSALQRQTKKSSRPDSWRIDIEQLNKILKWSATSTYWLIGSAGNILVIPAKHLAAVSRGTGKSSGAKSFTVGYNDARSVAIPLEQYLVDLLIGQWLGTSSDDVVQFAHGENTNIRPRTIIEVGISVGMNG